MERQQKIIHYPKIKKKGSGLKRACHAEVGTAMCRQMCNILSKHIDPAVAGGKLPVEQVEQGCLSCPIGTDHCQPLSDFYSSKKRH